MPIFSILYFMFVLSNFGFPGTINFVGEFTILVGGLHVSNVIVFFFSFGMILSLFYSLFFYNRVFFGFVSVTFIRFYSDCIRLEFFVLFILFILVIFFGVYPHPIIDLSLFSLLKFTSYFF